VLSLAGEVSSNHRRVISVRLRGLEDACVQLQELARPVERALTARSELAPRIIPELDTCISHLRSRISEMKADLDLQRTLLDPGRVAGALVASMMVNMEELRPHHLKGYGAVPERLAQYLDVRLEELLRTLREIERLLRSASAPADSGV
jgi:hypothetical protein